MILVREVSQQVEKLRQDNVFRKIQIRSSTQMTSVNILFSTYQSIEYIFIILNHLNKNLTGFICNANTTALTKLGSRKSSNLLKPRNRKRICMQLGGLKSKLCQCFSFNHHLLISGRIILLTKMSYLVLSERNILCEGSTLILPHFWSIIF